MRLDNQVVRLVFIISNALINSIYYGFIRSFCTPHSRDLAAVTSLRHFLAVDECLLTRDALIFVAKFRHYDTPAKRMPAYELERFGIDTRKPTANIF